MEKQLNLGEGVTLEDKAGVWAGANLNLMLGYGQG